jgi:dihydroorotase-like cyclic amidohydrolase
VVAHTSLLSTAQTIIACNKKFGTNIYMELTPHHLRWTENDITDTLLECFPRLRSAADRDGLLRLLTTIGTDPACKFMHGTDHAPHTPEAKTA